MQPLTLRAYDRQQNRLLIINGYELTKDDMVKVYGTHYDRYYKPSDVTILRSSGQRDASGEELFESDLAYNSKDKFVGIVKFRNGAFILEGRTKITLEWPPSTALKRLGNFLVDPLALDAAVN